MTVARTTKAFVLEKIGSDGLMERTRPVPPTGRGQLLVRMKAASLNFRDLKILKGVYFHTPVLPKVILSDGAGEVVEVGADVAAYQPGDRVLPIYMEGWYAGPMDPERRGWKAKSSEVDGVALEYAVYNEADLLPIPDSMSYAEAACTPCAGVTAWHALVSVGRLKTGDTVLVMGSGGVSIFGLQIARMSGARVIAISSDNAKLQRLLSLGASNGINYKEVPNWGDAVLDLTGGRGVDHVLEVGGDGTIQQSIRATREGGRIASVGNLSGGFTQIKRAERGIEIAAIAVGSREMNEDLMRAIDMHRQMPVIDSTFTFAELKKALGHLEAGKHVGKVVITF